MARFMPHHDESAVLVKLLVLFVRCAIESLQSGRVPIFGDFEIGRNPLVMERMPGDPGDDRVIAISSTQDFGAVETVCLR
jgi:hypothetical protein